MIGGVSAVGCLAVFGAESFILPAMGLILAAITLLRKQGDFYDGNAFI